MGRITTHVLDTCLGRPASGVVVSLERPTGADEAPVILGCGATDEDGRLQVLSPTARLLATGIYRLIFDTGAYYGARGVETLYPEVSVTFEVRDGHARYHIPLLLSPHGYSTYRGS